MEWSNQAGEIGYYLKKRQEAEFDAFKKRQEAEFDAFVNSQTKETGQHPEIRSGEIFLINISRVRYREDGGTSFKVDSLRALTINFSNIPFRTKRLGEVSYDENGKIMKDYLPVFVQRWEITRAKKE